MAAVQLWCRVRLVGHDGAALACSTLSGPSAPDLRAVNDVARLALMARRLGYGIVLDEVAPALRALLELAGLLVEVAGLGVEVQGQAELGEEPLGFQERQEERQPGDLPP